MLFLYIVRSLPKLTGLLTMYFWDYICHVMILVVPQLQIFVYFRIVQSDPCMHIFLLEIMLLRSPNKPNILIKACAWGASIGILRWSVYIGIMVIFWIVLKTIVLTSVAWISVFIPVFGEYSANIEIVFLGERGLNWLDVASKLREFFWLLFIIVKLASGSQLVKHYYTW